MDETLEIHSSTGTTIMKLAWEQNAGPVADSFIVTIRGENLDAKARVYSAFAKSMGNFFKEMASQWKGWKGEKAWESLEHELDLRASADSLGHITLRIGLRSGHSETDWRLSTVVMIDAGQLDDLAKRVEQFFSRKHAESYE